MAVKSRLSRLLLPSEVGLLFCVSSFRVSVRVVLDSDPTP